MKRPTGPDLERLALLDAGSVFDLAVELDEYADELGVENETLEARVEALEMEINDLKDQVAELKR